MKGIHGHIILALLFMACSPKPPVTPPSEVTETDAGDSAASYLSLCTKACSNLVSLGCPEGQPSPGGIACVDVCRNAGAQLDQRCVIAAKTKVELKPCAVRCQP